MNMAVNHPTTQFALTPSRTALDNPNSLDFQKYRIVISFNCLQFFTKYNHQCICFLSQNFIASPLTNNPKEPLLLNSKQHITNFRSPENSSCIRPPSFSADSSVDAPFPYDSGPSRQSETVRGTSTACLPVADPATILP